jgi:type VI secretion system FHA domain protein
MVLTIKAISYKGQPLVSPLTAVFEKHGGTLGRSSDNHLVLADEEKIVSGEHGIIKYENESYYYIDMSLNGTQVTNRNQVLHHEKILIKDQDALQVGDYDLELRLSSEASEASTDRHEHRQDALSISMFDKGTKEDREAPTEDNLDTDDLSYFLTNDKSNEYPNNGPATNSDFGLEIDSSFDPPAPADASRQASALPRDLSLDDFFNSDKSAISTNSGPDFSSMQTSVNESNPPIHRKPEKPPVIKKQSEAHPTEAHRDLLNTFLSATGIEASNDFPEDKIPKLMRTAGIVLRELVAGLMTVLRGRSELKSHFRVSMTTLKPAENNPLKFSPTVEEALKSFLINSHPGFIDAVDAVREGYEDITNHQLAITAGVQASLASILKRLDPQHFSEKFKDGLVLQKKTKCWDEYRQSYEQIVEEAIEDFFGDDFARAYEKQIDKLQRNRE